MPDKTATVINAYNQCAEAFAERFMDFTLYNDLFDDFLALLQDNARVLDIGCGPGNVAKYMLTHKPALRWTGVDLSEEMIKLASANIPQGQFFVRDLRALDMETGSFDAGIASFCLPHLSTGEAADFLTAFANALASGAYAYVSTMEGTGHRFEDTSFSGGALLYFNFYSRAFLEAQFARCGLHIVRADEKMYLERDGSATTDLIYFLQKNK